MEFVTTSVRQRGNRNRSLLLREKREWLKQRRVNGFKRCDRVNSKEVGNKWVLTGEGPLGARAGAGEETQWEFRNGL